MLRMILGSLLLLILPGSVLAQTTETIVMSATGDALIYLLLEHLFNLSHFLFNFAGELLIFAFGSHVGVVGDLARLLFDGALRLMHIAFYFVLRARVHVVSPYRF